MIILEDLSPEEKRIYLEESEKKSKTLLGGNNFHKYRSTLTNIFAIKDKLINKSIAENILEISLLQEQINFYDFDIKVTQNNIKSGLEFIPDLFKNLLDKMSSLKNHLILRVNKNGVINDVLNGDELSRKWSFLKDELIKENDINKIIDLDKIIASGDLEYMSSSKKMAIDIGKMTIFQVIFNTFRDTQTLSDKKNIFQETFYSSIFPDIKIEAETLLKEEPTSEDDTYLTQIYSSRCISVDRDKIKKLFLNNYAILKEKFNDYDHNSISIVSLDKETCWLESVNFGSKELINKSVSIEIEVCVEQI